MLKTLNLGVVGLDQHVQMSDYSLVEFLSSEGGEFLCINDSTKLFNDEDLQRASSSLEIPSEIELFDECRQQESCETYVEAALEDLLKLWNLYDELYSIFQGKK